MRRAVRRLTWILLSLGVMTVLCFGLLAELVPQQHAHPVPRFFNPAPRNVRDLSLDALDRVVRNGPGEELAARELARLGGASFPYVLPSFERLDVAARERVALALVPVALRMAAARPEELENGSDAVAFWTRFWQDRSVDFREPVVRRLVARLGERSLALRRDDVLELDSYALPELIRALGRVKTADDVRRVRSLSAVLSHVANEPWTVDNDASIAETAALVRRWRQWWDEQGGDYTALDGPHRLAAMIKETAYGRWLGSVLRGELGRTNDGRTGLDLVRKAGPPTLLIFGAVLGLGTLLGAFASARLLRLEPRWQRRCPAVALAFASLPAAALLARFGANGGPLRTVSAVVLLVLGHGALLVAARAGREAHAPFGLRSELRDALLWVSPQAPAVASAVLAAECGLGLPGLGPELRAALSRADLDALMAVSLCCAVAALLAMLLGDALRWLLHREPEESEP
ncbi:MAG TPA: hypothetical protein VGP93_08440 [Polyangiaceae bacterium]|nr:hypothetical protein [Polyangiaceae bacterium]